MSNLNMFIIKDFILKQHLKIIKENFDDKWEYYIFKLKYSVFNFVNLAAVAWRKTPDKEYQIDVNRPDIKTS